MCHIFCGSSLFTNILSQTSSSPLSPNFLNPENIMNTMKITTFSAFPVTPKNITKTSDFFASFSNNSVFCSTYVVAKSLNLGNRNPTIFLSHCSSKPTTDIDGNTAETIHTDPQNDQTTVHSSERPSVSNPTPVSKELVFDLGQSGSWDSIEVGSPVVKRFLSDDQERWYLWYYGRSEKNPGSVGLAVSINGVHWQRGEEAVSSSSGTGMIMTCGADWWAFDTMSIKPAEVMIMSSNKVRIDSAVYWMYYTGFSSSEDGELPQDFAVQYGLSSQNSAENKPGRVFRSLPGLAMSQDGRNWARIEGDHHSGALFDVGANGEWDSLFIASPHVVFHSKGDLRMYYHSFDPECGKFAVGLARSRDGIKWLKLGKVMEAGQNVGCFDEMGVMNACVVREKKDGRYLMAYEGVAKDGMRSVGLAVSDDGLKDWRRMSNEPVLKASSDDNGWDSQGVGCPSLVQMEGDEDQWRLYYTGVGIGGRAGIGLAVSQGNDIRSFRRWAGFHL